VGIAVSAAFALDLLGPAASPYDFFAMRTATALAGGLIAALVEETFFRGLMLTSLAASFGFFAAAIASSGAYALVHLLVSDPTLGRQGYTLGAGFSYLVGAVGRQVEPASVLPLVGLFLCGLVLAVAVRRTRSLYLAIGLHAGWAFVFQVLRHATRPLVEIPGHSNLATHHYLVGTLWAWTAVILSGALALVWCALAGSRPTLALANPRRGS
jgi:membrane protease YdiL (CAAX protease family)